MHSIFLVLAIRAGSHWELSEAEATQLSKACAAVARHYPVARTQKAADWAQLVLIIAVLGVPRAVESWQMNPANTAPGAPRPPVQPPAATQGLTNPGPIAPAAPLLPQTPSMLDPGSMAGSHLTAGNA